MKEGKITNKGDNGVTITYMCEDMVVQIEGCTVRVFDSGDEFQDYCNGGVTCEDIIRETEGKF